MVLLRGLRRVPLVDFFFLPPGLAAVGYGVLRTLFIYYLRSIRRAWHAYLRPPKKLGFALAAYGQSHSPHSPATRRAF